MEKHLEVYGNTIEMNQLQNNNSVIIMFPDDTDSSSFKSKQKKPAQTENDET